MGGGGEWPREMGIRAIPFTDILAKSPDGIETHRFLCFCILKKKRVIQKLTYNAVIDFEKLFKKKGQNTSSKTTKSIIVLEKLR